MIDHPRAHDSSRYGSPGLWSAIAVAACGVAFWTTMDRAPALAQVVSQTGHGPQPGGPRAGGPRRGASPGTPDVNIRFGSISTAAADARCAGRPHYDTLLCLTDALTATLSPELKAKTLLPYSFDNASRWSNFPPMGYRGRVGAMLSEFSAAQLGFVKAILKTASGTAPDEGLDELEQILNADDYLRVTADEAGFSSGNFRFAFLGTPAKSGVWQLYYGGHHTAFANTYADGRLTGASPSFRGVEPFVRFTQNGRQNAPMLGEQAAFARMLGALTSAQAAKAKLAKTYTDVIVGPQRDGGFPTLREGLKGSALSPAQKLLVLAAIRTYVGDIDNADAEVVMARYRRQLDDTYVAFAGTPGMAAENDYVRIDGPAIWIEYSMQPGRSIPGVHPHSVWRDRSADYGGTKPAA